MRILVIGGHGTIGKYLFSFFKEAGHDVITAGRNSGDYKVDIAITETVKALFEQVGRLDAIIVAAGEAKWAPFEELTEEDYLIGWKSKLMGQVNVLRYGRAVLTNGGSVTLSTGILADDPVHKTASAAMVNGAIHSFVKAVALELDTVRVNVVAAGVVEDSYEKYKDYFPGHLPVSMSQVANAYARSVLGARTGEVIRVY